MKADRNESCQIFLENLNDYLDNELDGEKTAFMKSHLDTCDECGSIYGQYKGMLESMSRLDADVTAPLECQAAWRAAVRCEAKRVSGRGKVFRNITRAAGAIAAALVVVIGVKLAWKEPVKVSGVTSVNSYAAETVEAPSVAKYSAYALTDAVDTADMLIRSDGENDASTTVAARSAQEVKPSVVIREASRKIESVNFDQCIKSVADLVAEYEGYFEQSTVEGQPIQATEKTGRVAKMTVRVPSVDLDAFLTGIDAVGDVVFSRETAKDISESYYDTKLRLNSAQAQLNRLNELVTTAADLSELLMLEEKISDVQYEIDSLSGEIGSWDSRVSLSTVSVTVTEVAKRDQVAPTSQSLGDRAKVAFYDSINWLNEFWQSAVVVLATIAPALIVLIPLALIVILIISRSKKRHIK